ncbi:MAG: catalase family peroxidase [Acidobacteria bacterium]|nr:catalase family peroxidase [Acidobacteriota bacterium]
MPLPSDARIVQLAQDLIATFDAAFGVHPGKRPAHAKGILLTGEFRAAKEAPSLTRAAHVQRESVRVAARFSNSTGLPEIPDTHPQANPRGLAIRFYLADRVHTDIIGHSADGFPTRNGEEFLEFLRAVGASDPSRKPPSPTPLELFLAAHPETLAFVQTPKPSPSSFAHERYFGVTAFAFTNSDGVKRFGRYRFAPVAGVEHLDDAALQGKPADFLFAELRQRILAEPVRFEIKVQVAEPGDVVDNPTVHWPEQRQQIPFGTVTLTGVAEDDVAQQKHIIFDPIPRVDGIEPSDDPLLELRAAVYLLSGRRRREASVGSALAARG